MRRSAAFLLLALLLLLGGSCSQQEGEGGRFQALTDYFSSEVKELTEEINEKRREMEPLPDIPYNLQQTDHLGFRTKPFDVNTPGNPFRPTILLDLGVKQPIDSVVLVPADSGFGAGYGFPVRFRVEVSDDLAFEEELHLFADHTDEDFPNPRSYPVLITPPNPAQHIEARYVRLTVTRPWTNGGRAVLALGELMVLHGGRNVAASLPILPKPNETIRTTNYGVDNSDESPPSWGRAGLVDSESIIGAPQGRKPSTNSGYQSEREKDPFNSLWVKVDLGRDAPLHEVRLFPARSGDYPSRRGFGFPDRYRVEIAPESDPGFTQPYTEANYTTYDIPNPVENPVSIRIPGTIARYVRFTATSLGEQLFTAAGPGNHPDEYVFALSEMQVFSSGENIAQGAKVEALNSHETRSWSTKNLTDGFTSQRNILPWPEYINGLEKRRVLGTAVRDLLFTRRGAADRALRTALGWSLGIVSAAVVISLALLWRHRLSRRREMSALRRRLAQDIHDEIGSGLGTISLLSQMGCGNDSHPELAREEFTEIHRISRTVTESLRDIVWFIHPQTRTVGDLAQRLKETANSMLAGIPHETTADTDSLRNQLPLEHKRQILMFFKEALHNVIRHSGATRADISISGDEKQMKLVVHDDGCGFDTAAPRAGAGMTGMKQRAKTLGGRLNVQSAPGEGTTLTLEVPWRSPRKSAAH